MMFAIAITTLITLLFVIGRKRNTRAGSTLTNTSLGAGEIEDLDLALETQLSRCRDSSSADDQLLSHKDQLEGILRKRLSVAVDRWDHPTILRFVKLFKPLGLEDEGLQVFVKYLKNVVSTRCRKAFEQTEVDFVVCLKNLLNDIVSAIEENDEILRYMGGEDGIARAICELRKDCGSCSYILEEVYWKLRKFAFEIPTYSCSLEIEKPVPLLDPREIEFYIQEMYLLAQLMKDYMEKMKSKIRSLTLVNPELGRQATKSVSYGYFSEFSWDMTCEVYVRLECLFMRKNVKKAIQIDERVPDTRISSMVDDVFYVLWTSCSRAIYISDITCVYDADVINCAVDLLEGVYSDALEANFRKSVGVQQTATALNNFEVSIEHAAELDRKIREQCSQASTTADLGIFWNHRLEEISHHFVGHLDNGMHQLVHTMKSQIEPILESVNEAIYDEANPWVQRVIYALDTNVACLEPLMTATNYDTYAYPVISFIVNWLCDRIFTSEGGHVQLPRDINMLASHLSNMTTGRPIEVAQDVPMEQLVAAVKSRIETVLHSVKTIDLDGEAIYDEANPWVQTLIHALLTNVAFLEPLTTTTNCDTFLYSVILFIVTWLRDNVFTLRLSVSGHVKLLRDISMLATHFASMARRPIQDVLDVLMEKLAATVTPRIEPVLESVKTISSEGRATYDQSNPWLQRLIVALETNVAWVEPLMTATNYDTFAYVVIDFIVMRLERIIISLEFSEGGQIQLRRDMEELAIHLSRMTLRPMQFQLDTLYHLASYGTNKPVMLHWQIS